MEFKPGGELRDSVHDLVDLLFTARNVPTVDPGILLLLAMQRSDGAPLLVLGFEFKRDREEHAGADRDHDDIVRHLPTNLGKEHLANVLGRIILHPFEKRMRPMNVLKFKMVDHTVRVFL